MRLLLTYKLKNSVFHNLHGSYIHVLIYSCIHIKAQKMSSHLRSVGIMHVSDIIMLNVPSLVIYQ